MKDYEQGGSEIFRETNDVERMNELNYNRLRELGVDEMAMDAIKRPGWSILPSRTYL